MARKKLIMATESYPTADSWDMGPPSAPPDIVELMVQWFLQNFEDPVQNMPWDEGEYVFVWGGPFYTREVLEDVFGAVVTPQAIEQAVAKIEEDGGLQWSHTAIARGRD
jgi:hypothetical protein